VFTINRKCYLVLDITIILPITFKMSSNKFKVKVLLSGIDNKIAGENGVHVSVKVDDTGTTIERDIIRAKHDAGVYEFMSSDIPEGHTFTACAVRIDADDVTTCNTGHNSEAHRIEENTFRPNTTRMNLRYMTRTNDY
jgi:hypothetical protein